MLITLIPGYPDLIGRRFAWVGYGNGPASYVLGGDPSQLSPSHTYIDTITSDVLSISGNYTVIPAQSSSGVRPTWKLKWVYAGGQLGVDGVSSSGGSGMTAGTYALTFSTGNATGTITVSTSAVTAINITSSGSGYLSVPTVSAATGGTPPTLTATIGIANGIEVPAGTNLSAETIQLAGFGGEY